MAIVVATRLAQFVISSMAFQFPVCTTLQHTLLDGQLNRTVLDIHIKTITPGHVYLTVSKIL